MQPQAAREFYALQQAVATTTANEVRALWKRRMGDDFDGSWRRIRGPVLHILTEGQKQMAHAGAAYVPKTLGETDLADKPHGVFRPDSLVGIASDGRPLETLADQAVTTAKVAVQGGSSTAQALNDGGQWLRLMATMQVADVARTAVGIGTAIRTDVGGYVRVLNPPVCQRCAVLGGRFYRWSAGFDRHPHDDCTSVPVRNARWAKAEGFLFDPQQAYRDGQIKDLTAAQVRAIEDGADLTDVVNAYRGMSTTATERGLSKRALREMEKRAPAQAQSTAASLAAGHPDLLGFLPPSVRNPARYARLTPEGIYRIAGNDRLQAIDLLRKHGYIA